MRIVTIPIILFYLICNTSYVFGQGVWSNNIVLTSQGAIDSFPINYPGITHINAALFIGSSGSMQNQSIIDLTPLAQVRQVWDLYISRNDSLKTLIGLHQIDTVINLVVYKNPGLQNLYGLDALRYCLEGVYIQECANLKNLHGLEQLEYARDFNIKENQVLVSLDSLINLKQVFAYFVIEGNKSIKRLGTLPNYRYGFQFDILGNESLTGIGSFPMSSPLEYLSFGINIMENPALKNLDDFYLPGGVLDNLNIIANPQLENIDGLKQLRRVTNEVEIAKNPKLKRIAMPNLERCGRILLKYNGVDSIAPFDSLRFVYGEFNISYCHNLKYMQNLFPNTDTIGNFRIHSNNGLISIHEDKGPEFMGDFIIGSSNWSGDSIPHNPKLRYITGFERLKKIIYSGMFSISKTAFPADSLFLFSGFNQLEKANISIGLGGIEHFNSWPDTSGYLGTIDGFNGLKHSDYISIDGPPNAHPHVLKGFHSLNKGITTPSPKLFLNPVIDTLDAFGSVNGGELYVETGMHDGAYIGPNSFALLNEIWILVNGAYQINWNSSPFVLPGYEPLKLPELQRVTNGMFLQTSSDTMVEIYPNLSHLNYLYCTDNKELKHWYDFSSLLTSVQKIEISGNDSLINCHAICNILKAQLPTELIIQNALAPCSDQATVSTWCDTITSIKHYYHSNGEQAHVSPNPAQNGSYLYITLPDYWQGDTKVWLSNMLGNQLQFTQLSVSFGESQIQLPETLPSGVYYLNFIWQGEHASTKICIMN